MQGQHFDCNHFRPPIAPPTPIGGHNFTLKLQPNGGRQRKLCSERYREGSHGWAFDWCKFSPPDSPITAPKQAASELPLCRAKRFAGIIGGLGPTNCGLFLQKLLCIFLKNLITPILINFFKIKLKKQARSNCSFVASLRSGCVAVFHLATPIGGLFFVYFTQFLAIGPQHPCLQCLGRRSLLAEQLK